MPILPEIGTGLPGETIEKKFSSLVKQLNAWVRKLASEKTLAVVKSDTTTITSEGEAITTVTVAHGLDFTPIVKAHLTESSLSNNGVLLTDNACTPLPTHLNALVDNGTPRSITFSTWIYCTVDGTNIYFILLNARASVVGPVHVKYYLLRETAD